MNDSPTPNHSRDALDELVEKLLQCGAVLSHMIHDMVEFEASGRSAPGSPPVLEVAHELILGVIGPVGARHPGADIEKAVTIIEEVMQEICEGIFVVSDELLEAAGE